MFRSRGQGPPNQPAAALVLGLIGAVSILQTAFYVQGRHRFLVEPLLLIFTAIGATAVARGGRLR